MKKIFLSTLVICMAFLTSCHKDPDHPHISEGLGTYKNLHKLFISGDFQYYYSYNQGQTWESQGNTHINAGHEVYNWDIPGGLTSIIGNYTTPIEYRFSYNEDNHDQVSEIEFYYDGILASHDVLLYSDSIISQIQHFNSDGDLLSVEEITYTGNKPTKIARSSTSYTELTWSGNNLTEYTIYYTNDVTLRYTFTYDNHKNPFSESYALKTWAFCYALEKMSQNNVVSEVHKNLDNGTETVKNYSYNYYQNYPTEQIMRDEYVYESGDYLVKEISEIKKTFQY
ncbi:MAG: hypothetical protein J6P64_02165 [Bacteroidales bacterium]|nr:hypothetical protein [Bacteroidales bacterium]